MKPHLPIPLYLRILGLLVLNAAVLGGVFYLLLRLQFGSGLGSALGRMAAGRIQDVAESAHARLSGTERARWDDALAEYARSYGLNVSLVGGDGARLAGAALQIPDAVRAEMQAMAEHLPRGGPPGGRRPPPPRGDDLDPLSEWFDAAPAPPPQRPGPDGDARRMGTFLQAASGPDGRYWAGALLRPLSREPRAAPAFLILASPSITGNGLFFDLQPWLWGGFGGLALSALLWLPLMRGITRAIREAMRATEAVARGRFDVRVDSSRRDELGRLGAAVNHMAEQLGGYVRGQKRFIGDIAHELCSPIARMEVGLAILDQGVAEAQRERLQAVRGELHDLSTMVGELLQFSKTALGADAAPLEAVPLRPLIEEAAAREGVQPAWLRWQGEDALRVLGRPELLKRAFGNVIRNALLHAPQSPCLEIETGVRQAKVCVRLSDRGPGVPEADLPRLFDPFFRVDTARAAETGGSGLGLAIVRTCVEACGGSVIARNRPGDGFEVEFQLQAATAAAG